MNPFMHGNRPHFWQSLAELPTDCSDKCINHVKAIWSN